MTNPEDSGIRTQESPIKPIRASSKYSKNSTATSVNMKIWMMNLDKTKYYITGERK